jgi:trans-AT polyketide synthase/acyltransferase/oxidoreductase domain-containing protein
MSLPIIFMYSGQGSHYYQMGKALFETNKTFNDWMQRANAFCYKLIGLSVIDHLYDNQKTQSQPFTRTLITHPAIFMVEYALTQVLLEHHIQADFVFGTSVGEFAAAATSGILTFEDALQTVIRQAEMLEKYCHTGGMLAILADPSLYHAESWLHQHCELAAINFSSHFVVSGKNDALKVIEKKLKEQQIVSVLLPVSHGFHSTLIDGAKTHFMEAIKLLSVQKAKLPFISCVEAQTVNSLTPPYFWEVLRSPILFQNTIQYLEKQQPALYIDLGPSGTLATFIKYNLSLDSASKAIALLTPYSQETKNIESILKKILSER